MKRWGKWVIVSLLLLSCKSKKEGDAFLFILSLDPLEYFSVSVGSGLNLDTSEAIDTGTEDPLSVNAATITAATGTGFAVSDAVDIITSLDTAPDIETVVNLGDSTREAYVGVAEQNIRSCTGVGLFTSISCALTGFVVDIGSVLSTATGIVSLQISGINLDGDAVTSNVLSARRYILRLVSRDGTGIADAKNFVEHDDVLYFNANTDASNSYLMSYDGTDLKQVANFGESAVDDAFPLASVGGQLLLKGNNTLAVENLFYYNGTTINQVLDLNAGAGDTIGNAVTFGDYVYFTAEVAGVAKIYRYNGTTVDQMTNDAVNDATIVGVADDGIYYELDSDLYRLSVSTSFSNKKVTEGFTHTNSEYFVLNGKMYFTATFGGDHTFVVDGDAIKRVANFDMSGISVYNNVAYGLIDEGAYSDLYRYTGSVFERLNPSGIRVSKQPTATPILATATGVYFVNDPDTTAGNANELYRYNSRRFEKLLSLETAVATSASVQGFHEYGDEVYFTAYAADEMDRFLYKLELQDN